MDEAVKRIDVSVIKADDGFFEHDMVRVRFWDHGYILEPEDAQELRDKLNTALGMVAH